MSDAKTAQGRLERLLHLIPAAMRPDGALLDDSASELGTSVERLMEDLEELTARSFYQPGGWPDDVQIFIEGAHVRVMRATGLERPVRLNREETLCLAIALRGAAARAHLSDDGARSALLARAEAHLGTGPGEVPDGPVATPERHDDPEGVRSVVVEAVRGRRPCALWYVKSGARDGSVRVVRPYRVLYGEGAWYLVAHCEKEDGVRVFRLDRILAADLAEGSFTVPEDFDAEEYIEGGRVFHVPDGIASHDVRVRYSPKIARWIRERARWEPEQIEDEPDGAIVLRHRVTDPQWAVGHALMYGSEAEVLEPADIRALVREAVRVPEA